MVTRELVIRAVEDIIPYENNPRINDDAAESVAESIRQCGYCSPIVVDEDGVILAGHTRHKAIKKLGWAECEVVVCTGMTEEQKRKYRILDNRTNELSSWNFDQLAKEVEDLDFGDLDDIIKDMMPEIEEAKPAAEDDGFEMDPPEEPKTRLGDIYQLGRHRLMCGDSTKPEDIAKLMGGQEADLLLTDPPYGVAYEGTAGTIENDDLEDAEFLEFLKGAFSAADSVMKPGAAFYIWHADSRGLLFRQACKEIGWQVRQCLIWVKNALVLGRQDYQWKHEPCLYGWKDGAAHYFIDERTNTTVIEDQIDIDELKKDELKKLLEDILADYSKTTVLYADKPLKNGIHPTMKPIELMGELIVNSTQKGWNVLDSFGGSGSTMIACEQLGRNAYLMELDPKYADCIVTRWQELTGQKAVLLPRE